MVHTLLLAPFTFAYLTASFVLASLAPVQSHLLPTSRPYERPVRTFRSVLHSMDLLCEVLEPGKVTLVVPLSWEVGDGFLTCSGNFSRDIFPTLRNRAERSRLLLRLRSAHSHQRCPPQGVSRAWRCKWKRDTSKNGRSPRTNPRR